MIVSGSFGVVGSWVIWDENEKFNQYGEILHRTGAGPGVLLILSIAFSLIGWWISNVAKNLLRKHPKRNICKSKSDEV